MSMDRIAGQKRPATFIDDPLTIILRQLARRLVVHDPKAEIECHEMDFPQQPSEKAGVDLVP